MVLIFLHVSTARTSHPAGLALGAHLKDLGRHKAFMLATAGAASLNMMSDVLTHTPVAPR
jgi:hypothetical protein